MGNGDNEIVSGVWNSKVFFFFFFFFFKSAGDFIG